MHSAQAGDPSLGGVQVNLHELASYTPHGYPLGQTKTVRIAGLNEVSEISRL